MTLISQSMTLEEAQAAVTAIRDGVADIRRRVLEIYERKGYLALGYGTFEEFAIGEFGKQHAWIYQQKDAALVDRIASDSTGVEKTLPISHTRKLATLKQPDKITQAMDIADNLAKTEGAPKTTERHITQAVNVVKTNTDPDRQSVLESPYSHLIRMVNEGEATAKNAAKVVLALDACDTFRRPFMIRAKLMNPAVIAELNRMSWDSFNEIVMTGFLQYDEPDKAVKITNATYKDVMDWKRWKFENHRRDGALNNMLVLSLNPRKSDQVVRELKSLPLETLAEVAVELSIYVAQEVVRQAQEAQAKAA